MRCSSRWLQLFWRLETASRNTSVFWGRVMSISQFITLNLTNKIFPSLCTFPQLSSLFLSLTKPPLSLQHISLLLPLSFTPFLGSADCHCYLPNIVWQRRSGIFCWLKIKVAKSPPQNPPLLLAALKNRGKHQFLTHQWRLHNQLKRHLYRDANLIFVLLELLEDACRDLMLWNKRGSLFLI